MKHVNPTPYTCLNYYLFCGPCHTHRSCTLRYAYDVLLNVSVHFYKKKINKHYSVRYHTMWVFPSLCMLCGNRVSGSNKISDFTLHGVYWTGPIALIDHTSLFDLGGICPPGQYYLVSLLLILVVVFLSFHTMGDFHVGFFTLTLQISSTLQDCCLCLVTLEDWLFFQKKIYFFFTNRT